MKSRLTARERTRLRGLAETLVPKGDIAALCAYGSRIAGYAKKDSEYDLIIVTKDSKEPEKQGTVPPTALIITEANLQEEATKSSTKEFVVGRFLNVYEPIINPELLRRVEVDYKKRVIAEAIVEIQSEYGGFSSDLILPYEYFLFNKLHKRVAVYPEASNALASTYSGPYRTENLEFAIRGFREAAESLASSGLLRVIGESVRIIPGEVHTDLLSKIAALLLPSKEGKPQPTGVGYAVLRGKGVVGPESSPKPIGKRGKVQPPVEIERPKKLLRLDEGVVFDDASKITADLARMSGFHGEYTFKEKKKGEIYTSTHALEISSHGKRVKYILKSFPDLKSVKWALLNMWAFTGKKFNMTPFSRIQREYEGARRLRKLGIGTHRIVGIAPDQKLLVSKYVEGVPLSEFVEKVTSGKSTDTKYIQKYAVTLAKLHKDGLVYGDTKAENAFVCEDDISLFDLEQTVENGDAAWDIAEFLYFCAKDAGKEEGMKLVSDSFLASYRSKNGASMIKKASEDRYLVPFRPFVSLGMSKVIGDSFKKYS